VTPEFSLAWGIIAATLIGILVITLLTVGLIAFVFRRVTRPVEDPALTELKRRLADGEITPVEYEVRLRALQQGD
jgi:Predicted membrane protein (DUF2078).